MPSVVLKDSGCDVSKLPVDKPEWHRLTDLVAVMFDVKSSTNLGKRGVGQPVRLAFTTPALVASYKS